MPKTPINYENACVYKICCKNPEIKDCYVGSTTNFKQRKNAHRRCCSDNNKNKDIKIYKFIRDNGEWDNWDMILVEKVNVNDGYELKKEERKWIEQLNATLNCRLPTRTKNEYYNDNKEKLNEYKKEWYAENKEKILEHKKNYYEENKEIIKEKIECPICNSIVRKDNLKRHQKTKKCLSIKNKHE